jgi:hypothetical protein
MRFARLLALPIAIAALTGCGGSSATSSSSSTSTTATTSSTTGKSRQALAPPAKNSGKEKAGPGKPSAGDCIAAWNRIGPAPSLKNVLLPVLRASGPFRAEVGTAAGLCAIVVHATGVEGGAAVTYEIAQRPDSRFVQGAVPDLGGSARDATLGRDGKLSLGS